MYNNSYDGPPFTPQELRAAAPGRKLLYALAFPLFTFTYLPISLCALFQRVEWKPIHHGARRAKGGWLHFRRIRGKIEVPR